MTRMGRGIAVVKKVPKGLLLRQKILPELIIYHYEYNLVNFVRQLISILYQLVAQDES